MRIHFMPDWNLNESAVLQHISCKHTVHTGAYCTLCFSLRVISFKMLSMFIRSGAGHGFHRTFRFLYALTPHCRISQGVRLTSCHRFHKSCFDLLHKPRHLTVDRNPFLMGMPLLHPLQVNDSRVCAPSKCCTRTVNCASEMQMCVMPRKLEIGMQCFSYRIW